MAEFRIHPPIGVARLGNSPTEVMFAPETTLALPSEIVDGLEVPVEQFRDAAGSIKREAARFKVYDEDDGRLLEIGQDGLVDIEWTVWVANKKAQWFEFRGLTGDLPGQRKRRNNDVDSNEERRQLIIDPGPRTVSQDEPVANFTAEESPDGHVPSFPPDDLVPFVISTLGGLRVDTDGTLNVLAGFGNSGSAEPPPVITSYANNDKWYDDVADGPVNATLVFADGTRTEVPSGAWVICAPPGFAPEIGNPVTLFDVIFDTNVRNLEMRPDIFADGEFNEDYIVNFASELAPFFRRVELVENVERRMPSAAHLLDWDLLRDASEDAAPARFRILEVIRSPGAPDATRTDGGRLMMPYALGDNPYSNVTGTPKFLTVTATQYFLLSQWAAGNFEEGTVTEGLAALDRAALDNCVGGAFFPGIETTWIVRDPRIYSGPLRIRHRDNIDEGLHLADDLDRGLEPGDLTKRMALPWQADFNECFRETNSGLTDVSWWPAQRPLSVLNERFERVEWSRGIPVGRGGDLDMVINWHNLGFVRRRFVGQNELFLETERNGAPLGDPIV